MKFPPFFVMPPPHGVVDHELEERRDFEYRDNLISSIPQIGGTYTLFFPNGKTYVGHSDNLQNSIRKDFEKLVLTPRRRRLKYKHTSWHLDCRKENPNLKNVDIGISYDVCTANQRNVECGYKFREEF